MHIGERIKYARKSYRLSRGLKPISQEALAFGAGMERGKLSLIELGITKNVSEADSKALAAALGVSPCWLALKMGPIEIPQLREGIILDVQTLANILEVVLDVVAHKGLRTTPERLSKFIARRYQEEVKPGAEINRREIEKILEYFE